MGRDVRGAGAFADRLPVDIMGLLGDTDIPFYAREIKSEILYLKIYHSNSKFNRTEIGRLP